MTNTVDAPEAQQADETSPEIGSNDEKIDQTTSLNRRRPFLNRVLGVVKQIGKELIPIDEKIPPEQIDEQRVARVIAEQLGNPLQERLNGDRYANPFDIVSVITELGYITPSNSADYMNKFPEIYQAARRALRSLHQQGVLDQQDFEESNNHGERTYYKVKDRNLLSKVAQVVQPLDTNPQR